ncbi:uncharacterized protein EMH_0072790 [Eimeria mitis]|uniref:Uncharacterized protein n=1 Tax=Eimeria mitis TaxID=44415 RepID=U6KIX1_9EIME|nr:uncharacterized protein EMH_0072790 [Eimeria mitis]CDJ35388.1 hypothetical protein, conserved [Eimeria mitis]
MRGPPTRAPLGAPRAQRAAEGGGPLRCSSPRSPVFIRLFAGALVLLLQLAGTAAVSRARGAPQLGAPQIRGPHWAFQNPFGSCLQGRGPCLSVVAASSRQAVPFYRGPLAGGPLGAPQGRGPLDPLQEVGWGGPQDRGGPKSSLHAKGRPGGGGGVGPKKKTAQQKQQQQLLLQKQQQKQQQLQQLGGFAKHKKAKKAKEGEGGPQGTTKKTAASRGPKRGAATEGPPGAPPYLAAANLNARDLPYDMVSAEVFEVYKLFGRLCDPFLPHASLPPSSRLFLDRLFKGFTR